MASMSGALALVAPCEGVVYEVNTLTPLLELFVRLRERRQWDNDFAFVVGGTDTSRCTGPQLVLFLVPHSRKFRPESLKVPGMGPWQCGPWVWYWLVSTVVWLVLMERQLDLSSMAVG
ncbi:hypothetical protein Taro_032054 [Colocasia esculenta]|uniref:Uncharacterized protein n=1 Tax=Colocasia esculenta TaxID=4460 RepID=A0A843VKD5_COLES|nr:hypothetical protein [Colocasia esculenta]